ncbi:MAG TPA: DUF6391 domain-containing protein [Kofleriaceae bacterium]|nr:DUF6391 domain-containing protein [Kofleriaceae bacterium]
MTGPVERVKSIVPSLLLDALVVFVLAVPGAGPYLAWPLLGVYAVLSLHFAKQLYTSPWIVTILRHRPTRIVHGLEHATIALLEQRGIEGLHGATYGGDRFIVKLPREAPVGHQLIEAALRRAIARIQRGEQSLAYHPRCGTSLVVTGVTVWFAYVVSGVIALALGGSVPIFVAIGAIVIRLWAAWETSLGLLAQRWFTVSTDFASVRVVAVREIEQIYGYVRPGDETWFEAVVEVSVAASEGGLVAPGPLS